MAGGVQPQGSNGSDKGKDKDRRRALVVILMILVLLLLLCCVFAITYTGLYRVFQERVAFVSLNRDCLQCHVEMIPLLSKEYVHNPFARRACTECHTRHGRKASGAKTTRRVEQLPGRSRCGCFLGTASAATTALVNIPGLEPSELTSSMPELCYKCHGGLQGTMSAYKHQPFATGHCTSCHDPHASDYRKITVAPTPKLCTMCHRLKEQLDLPVQHPPFKAQHCLDCHLPHGSDQKRLLREPQKTLCLFCHPRISRLFNLPVQHPPFYDGNCTGCHKPHSSRVTKLLKDSQPDLCYGCHPTIKLDFLKPSHHPVNSVILAGCTGCHQPHAALYDKLLVAKDNNLCYTCHGDKQELYDASKHNTIWRNGAKGLCINCHTPHGSYHAPLLRKEELALCYSCHAVTSKTHPYSHPVGSPWKDERLDYKKRLTCSTTCHNPHGTRHKTMLRWRPDQLCLFCHEARELP